MGDPYIGEIRMFAYAVWRGQVPDGWLLCDGQICQVAQFQPLYSIIFNLYGGAYPKTFAVPNMMGYAPVGAGQGTGLSLYTQGVAEGAPSVTLTPYQAPAHNHIVNISAFRTAAECIAQPADANLTLPLTNVMADRKSTLIKAFTTSANSNLNPGSVSPVWTATPTAHENRQPFQAQVFGIAWHGVYPIKPS